ncbi:MAG: AIR synthase related protein [Thermoleophilia bacterium]|nr:AIR synthase related protein [Thermoleophilia bacterium]
MDLRALADLVRTHPGLLAKQDLRAVAAGIGGDGDDAAVVDGDLVVCAEAVWPPFVAASPRVAGVAAVVTVLSDLAATGARPLAVLDTLVAGDARTAREALAGLRSGAALFGVPVVGGHTTLAPGTAALSTFALGRAARPLRAAAARPGDALVLVTCLEGEMLPAPEGAAFFSHLRGPRRARAGADLALLAEAAEAGEAWAARDVSMPGVAGSLVQMAESAGGLGSVLDLDALPLPAGVPLERWLVTFPSYGFLLAGDPARLAARFGAAGLACARVGAFDASGVVRLRSGGRDAVVWDLGAEPLTGLRPGVAGG